MCNTPTHQRILAAALELASRHGVRKTSLEDVAHLAGVSRLTVYRNFHDRRGLVEAVCRHVTDVFREAADGQRGESVRDVDERLIRLFQRLEEIPYAELGPAFREIGQLYPDMAAEFRGVRDKAVDDFLNQAFAAATREGALRRSFDPEVLRSLFRVTLLGLLEWPQALPAGTRLETVLSTLLNVFRYGALERDATVVPIPVSDSAPSARPRRKLPRTSAGRKEPRT